VDYVTCPPFPLFFWRGDSFFFFPLFPSFMKAQARWASSSSLDRRGFFFFPPAEGEVDTELFIEDDLSPPPFFFIRRCWDCRPLPLSLPFLRERIGFSRSPFPSFPWARRCRPFFLFSPPGLEVRDRRKGRGNEALLFP